MTIPFSFLSKVLSGDRVSNHSNDWKFWMYEIKTIYLTHKYVYENEIIS